jgi:ribosome-binding factor A
MSPKRKRERRDSPLPCGAVGADDLIDPKLLLRSSPHRRDDRGARRLCSQVREALTYALAGSCRDDVLQSLYVAEVEPAPDATRLAVTLVVADSALAETARARLALVAALLREEVAASIHRRRAPELAFRVVPSGEAGR